MRREENDCVGCSSIGLYCIGPSCPNRHRIHHYCDSCEKEKILYYYDDGELCEDCIEEHLAEGVEFDDLELEEVDYDD